MKIIIILYILINVLYFIVIHFYILNFIDLFTHSYNEQFIFIILYKFITITSFCW